MFVRTGGAKMLGYTYVEGFDSFFFFNGDSLLVILSGDSNSPSKLSNGSTFILSSLYITLFNGLNKTGAGFANN